MFFPSSLPFFLPKIFERSFLVTLEWITFLFQAEMRMFEALSYSKAHSGMEMLPWLVRKKRPKRWNRMICSAGKVFSIATEAEHMSP